MRNVVHFLWELVALLNKIALNLRLLLLPALLSFGVRLWMKFKYANEAINEAIPFNEIEDSLYWLRMKKDNNLW